MNFIFLYNYTKIKYNIFYIKAQQNNSPISDGRNSIISGYEKKSSSPRDHPRSGYQAIMPV